MHYFNKFSLSNAVYAFGIDAKQENKLSEKVTIEPFKGKNLRGFLYVIYKEQVSV